MSSSAFDIAAAGMAAHRLEMDLIAENLANEGTARAAGAPPYRAKVPVFEETPERTSGSFSVLLADAQADNEPSPIDWSDGSPPTGVQLSAVVDSQAVPQYRYDPDDPAAIRSGERRGFVATADVDPIGQMVSLVSAGRAYDADVAALQAAKQMDVEAIDVERT